VTARKARPFQNIKKNIRISFTTVEVIIIFTSIWDFYPSSRYYPVSYRTERVIEKNSSPLARTTVFEEEFEGKVIFQQLYMPV